MSGSQKTLRVFGIIEIISAVLNAVSAFQGAATSWLTVASSLLAGYLLLAAAKNPEKMDGILIATGSEVSLAIDAQAELAKDNIDVRVVSMPCMDLFEQQTPSYKEEVLPKAVRARVAVEALSDFGWGKYVGLDGATVTMHGFGASAPAGLLFEKFGFTKEHVADVMKEVLKK